MEAFNNILDTTSKNIFNIQHDDWDQTIPIVLWAYRTSSNRFTGDRPFKLVYGKEVVMAMEFIVPRLRFVALTNLMEENAT